MELEITKQSEKKLKKASNSRLPKSLRRYLRWLKTELRKNFVSEAEIKNRINEIILKYKNEK